MMSKKENVLIVMGFIVGIVCVSALLYSFSCALKRDNQRANERYYKAQDEMMLDAKEGHGTRLFADALESKINIYLAHGWRIVSIAESVGCDSYVMEKKKPEARK